MPRQFRLLLGLLVLALSLQSAAALSDGLEVLNQSFTVNKTAGTPVAITFSLRNNEPFTFFNITFEANPDIQMPKLDQLESGATASITAVLVGNESISKNIRVRGFYQTNVGKSDRVFPVNVTAFQSTPCDLTIIEGDSVAWTSRLLSPILMVNADSGLPIDGGNMQFNQTFTKQFNSPETLRYSFSVSGISFPQSCTITVLSGTGLVNNPNFDAEITLNVQQNFPPTLLEAVIPVTSYSLEFFQTADGSLSLFNKGNSTAKGIKLESDWLSFNKNNFELKPGESTGVSYTILPRIGSTAETNKSYTKPLKISGNFPTISTDLNVFVPHAIISGNLSDFQNATTLIDFLCRTRPDLCQPQIVYRTTNNASGSANISVSQSSYEALLLALLEEKESRVNSDRADTESNAEIKELWNETRSTQQAQLEETKALKESYDTLRRNLILSVATVLLIGCTGLIGFLVVHLRRRAAQRAFDAH